MIADNPAMTNVALLPALPWFAPRSWRSVERAFAGGLCREFGQPWLPEPEPNFRPGVVRLGWRGEALWVYAEMQDDDIFNLATKPNQPTWQTGDALEIFLRPLDQEDYFELHVTPENQTLRLHFPSARAYDKMLEERSDWRQFAVRHRVFSSRTLVEKGQWRALMRIPARAIVRDARAFAEMSDEARAPWAFLLGRYDATRPPSPEAPAIKRVVSSTANLTGPKFHCQNQWERFALPFSEP